MAAVTLQFQRPFDGVQSRSIVGPSTGSIYLVNALGQVVVAGADAPYLIAQGWAPLEPGSGINVALVDFGAFPGSNYASVTIPNCLAVDTDALVEAYVMPIATADHSADEHAVDGPVVYAASDGAGNLIISAYPNNNVPKTDSMLPWGKWSVAWGFLQ